MKPTIEDIKKLQELMDKKEVPEDNRRLSFINEKGEYEEWELAQDWKTRQQN